MSTNRVDVAVVGGGLAGLAAALELKQAGRSVRVLEAGPSLGGKAINVVTPHGRFPGGPTSFNGRHPAFWRLLRLLGIETEARRLDPRSGARFIVRDGKLAGIEPNPLKVLTTSALSLGDKVSFARDLLGRKHAPTGEDESLDAFLARRFGRSTVDHFLAAVMTGIFAGDLKKLSAESCMPALVTAEREYGSVVRGLLKGLGKAEDGSRPGLYTFEAGMGRMAERAQEVLDATCGAKVTGLKAGAGGVEVRYESSGEARTLSAGKVVLAAEAHFAAPLLEALAPQAAAVLRGFEYAPVSLVHWVEKTPGDSKLPNGFGYLSAPIENCFALGTLFVGDLLAEKARRFATFVGGAVFPERAALDDLAMQKGLSEDLLRLTGGTVGELVHVQRWAKGVFQPPVGHKKQLAKLEEAMKGVPVALAGSYFGGAAMKDALVSGFAAAERLLAAEGATSAAPAQSGASTQARA